MVIFQGKLRGDTPPNRVRVVWTDGSVEPYDEWMMVTMHGIVEGWTKIGVRPSNDGPQFCIPNFQHCSGLTVLRGGGGRGTKTEKQRERDF